MINFSLAERLRSLRKAKGLTQAKVAELSRITLSYYRKLERGVKTNPTYDVLQKLAAALNCTIDELLKENDQAV